METNTNKTGGGQTIQAVESAFKIIETLEITDGATVSEIADELDIATSTAYVYVKTLKQLGYIEKSQQHYHLGPRFLKHGCFARQRMKIYQAAKEETKNLASQTEELISLGIEDNGQRVVLYRAEGTEAVHDQAPTGEYTYMHWTGLGKAILAYLSSEHVDEIIDTYGLPRATEHTITDRTVLHEELDRIRTQGYAVGDEERKLGLRSAGVPILCDGDVQGAIAIAGPKQRLTIEEWENELLDEFTNSVNVIELKYKHY
jgi:DNA-binding IclR family transcriptional regulator